VSAHSRIPPFYAILSADVFPGDPEDWALRLSAAGVRLIQYRDKHATAAELLRVSRHLTELAASEAFHIIVNDRADIAAIANTAGVHVGQEDIPVEGARRIVGPDAWVGISTHNLDQLRAASATSADYIAVGPIYATTTKANPDPVAGLDLIRQARAITTKPLVAIGGITAERATEVYAAGADSVAVAADLAAVPDLGARVKAYLEAYNHTRSV